MPHPLPSSGFECPECGYGLERTRRNSWFCWSCYGHFYSIADAGLNPTGDSPVAPLQERTRFYRRRIRTIEDVDLLSQIPEDSSEEEV